MPKKLKARKKKKRRRKKPTMMKEKEIMMIMRKRELSMTSMMKSKHTSDAYGQTCF